MQMKFFEIKTILWPLLAKQSPIRCSAVERAGEMRANNSINKQHIVTVAVAVATKADDCTTAQQLHEQWEAGGDARGGENFNVIHNGCMYL